MFAPALVLVAVAVCWSALYPFWPNRTLLLDQGKLVDYSWLAFALFVGGIATWLWALWMLLPALHGVTFTEARTIVVAPSVILLGAFTLMYPTNAIDVYIYAARSRLLTEYGQNPNSTLPEQYWDIDPYMRYASREWADNTSPYGPLWNLIAAPVTALSGDNIGLAVIGFKLVSVIATVIIAWLIYDAVRTLSPEWALPAALFWLWNPLVLWDGIGNAHNDVTLMLPVVAALWAWVKRRDNLVLPLLIASLLVKYVTVILIPIAIIALWRRNPDWSRRAEGLLWTLGSAVALLSVSLYPFYDLEAIRDSAQEQGIRVSSSLAWWVMATAGRWGFTGVDAESTRNTAYAIAIVGIGVCAALVWQRPDRLLRVVFETMFIFMLVASTNQRGWYVIWLVPLAAILIPQLPWRRALLWSVTSLAGHASSIWLWSVWDWDTWDRHWYSTIMVAVVFGPVLLLTAWEAWQWTRTRATGTDHAATIAEAHTSPR